MPPAPLMDAEGGAATGAPHSLGPGGANYQSHARDAGAARVQGANSHAPRGN